MAEAVSPAGCCADIIAPGLKVLFVGFNPGQASGRTGFHFAGRNNRFWDLLADAGLTRGRLTYDQDRLLLESGFGITNVVARATPGSGDLSAAELKAGGAQVRDKIAAFRPRIACYLGKGVYAAVGGKPSRDVSYGRQEAPAVPGTVDFVAPSPSGRATIPYGVKLRIMVDLAALVRNPETYRAERPSS